MSYEQRISKISPLTQGSIRGLLHEYESIMEKYPEKTGDILRILDEQWPFNRDSSISFRNTVGFGFIRLLTKAIDLTDKSHDSLIAYNLERLKQDTARKNIATMLALVEPSQKLDRRLIQLCCSTLNAWENQKVSQQFMACVGSFLMMKTMMGQCSLDTLRFYLDGVDPNTESLFISSPHESLISVYDHNPKIKLMAHWVQFSDFNTLAPSRNLDNIHVRDQILGMLLDKGISLSKKCYERYTPMSLAGMRYSNHDNSGHVLRILWEHGADWKDLQRAGDPCKLAMEDPFIRSLRAKEMMEDMVGPKENSPANKPKI